MTAAALSACAGENLFQLGAVVGGSRPTVEITAPTANASVAQGATVQVRADVNAPTGLSSADYSGVYVEGGTAAFVAEVENFQGPLFATLDNTLNPALNQIAGDVWIVVKVTDAQGESAADTVKITIN